MNQYPFSQGDYDTSAIRQLLAEALDDEELTILCFDHFDKVYQKFTEGITRTRKIQMLIEHCKRRNLFSELLSQVERANPKKYGEYRYRVFLKRRLRLNAEWVGVNALRETVGFALKGSKSPTYAQTLSLGGQLAPDLFDPDQSLLARRQESSDAREYREIAQALGSLEGRIITPVEAVNRDIVTQTKLIGTGIDQNLLSKRLYKLNQIRQELEPGALTEQQLVLRDIFRTRRALPISEEGTDYREYQVPNDRILRLRMLHPDSPEHSTGADVIYEHYWDKKTVVRLAVIKYQIWDNRVLLKSPTLRARLDRLQETFCKSDLELCKAFEGSKRKDAYRLPYCSAFLRPTDKLQDLDSPLISSGYHIPTCVVERLWQSTQDTVIASSHFRSESVTHRVFEELFNINMLGSRWLTYEELERLYREHKILDADERIVIHAQEFGAVI